MLFVCHSYVIRMYSYVIHISLVCTQMFIWAFFYEHARFTWQQWKGEGISVTPLYHFQPLYRQLDNSWSIAVELNSARSQQLVSNREPLVSERKLLSTKLRTLNVIVCHLVCHPYVTRMSPVYHSYVLVWNPYVTHLWFSHEPFMSIFKKSR